MPPNRETPAAPLPVPPGFPKTAVVVGSGDGEFCTRSRRRAQQPAAAVLPVGAIGDRRLKGIHLRVLAALGLLAAGLDDPGAWVRASQADLAELTGDHRKRLPEAVARLEATGYLVAHRGTGGRTMGLYQVVFDTAAPAAACARPARRGRA